MEQAPSKPSSPLGLERLESVHRGFEVVHVGGRGLELDAFEGLGHLDKVLSEGPDGIRILGDGDRCDPVADTSGLILDALHEIERVGRFGIAVGLGGIVVVLGETKVGCDLSDGALQERLLLGEVLLLRGSESLLDCTDDIVLLDILVICCRRPCLFIPPVSDSGKRFGKGSPMKGLFQVFRVGAMPLRSEDRGITPRHRIG